MRISEDFEALDYYVWNQIYFQLPKDIDWYCDGYLRKENRYLYLELFKHDLSDIDAPFIHHTYRIDFADLTSVENYIKVIMADFFQ